MSINLDNLFPSDEENDDYKNARAQSASSRPASITDAEMAAAAASVALSDAEERVDSVLEERAAAAAVASHKKRRRRIQAGPAVPDPHAAVRDWSAVMRQNVAAANAADDAPMAPNGLLIQGDEREKIKDQWEFYPFDDDDWTDVVEMAFDPVSKLEYPEDIYAPDYDPDYCYLCACTQSDKELEGNPNLKTFIHFLNENYSKMNRKELGIQGQRSYNLVLRFYATGKKAMRCKVILDHLEKHAPTLRIQLEHQNRTLNSCLMEQSRQLREQEVGTKRARLSTHHVNTYLKLAAFQNDVTSRLSKIRPDASKK
jgi:hypothetical protein